VVAHLDHHLRPDSAADARFVREQARRAGAAFVQGDWRAHAARGIGIEAAARQARYRFLAEVARTHGLRHVATGHHRDDQAETVLHRLVRGVGPAGLKGIRCRRPLGDHATLVRPLLPFGRAEILAYLAAEGLPWREDPTNRDGANLRSIIRARLMPFLSPGVEDLAGRLADLSGRSAAVAWPVAPEGGTISAEIRRRPLLLRAAVEALLDGKAPPLESRTMGRIEAALENRSGSVDLGRGYRLRVSGNRVVVQTPGTAGA
jgi:tRNA(Ile)-lysidine synthetase-like protein